MKTKKEENVWIQCQCCGKIYQVEEKVPIDISIIKMKCPNCGKYTGLNLGNDIEDLYIYMNPNCDTRYY